MRLAIMFLGVAVLASTTQALAQDSSKGKVSPYYYFILESCPGKNLEVTLKSGQKLSGTCNAQLADGFQITRKGMTYDIPYISIANINTKRGWFGKLKDAAATPFVHIRMAIGIAQFYNDFL